MFSILFQRKKSYKVSAGDSVEEEERYNINLKLFCDSVLHKLYIFYYHLYLYHFYCEMFVTSWYFLNINIITK